MTDHTDFKESLILEADSPEKTFAIGKKLGEILREGDVVALIGELGSGKTTFTQGLADGLGISGEYTVTSPTFNLINEYPGRIFLFHMDVYRLSSVSDLDDLGFDEYLNRKGVTVVEWAEKIITAIPREAIFINFECTAEETRKLFIEALASKIEAIKKNVEKR